MILPVFFLIFILLLLWMFRIEPNRFQINYKKIRIKKQLNRPLRVLHLSDTHFTGASKKLDRFFDKLVSIPCDLVALTGDLVDCEEGIPEAVKNLAKLKPAFGIYVVYGNHDYYDYNLIDSLIHNFPGQKQPRKRIPVDLLQEELEKHGIRVLRNETAEILCDQVPLLVHGLDDPITGCANIRLTMANFDPGKINILLTHTIDVFLDVGENEIDLSFSGHSHGGQICLPVIGPLHTHTMLGRAYASGICYLHGAVCSISRGLGTTRYLPMRLLAPPEAILVEVETEGK